MDKFSISEKTVRRNMLIVIDVMREIYGKIVIWDKKQKAYRVYKNINEC